MMLHCTGIGHGDHRRSVDLFYFFNLPPIIYLKKKIKFNIFIYVFISSVDVQLSHILPSKSIQLLSKKRKKHAHIQYNVHMDCHIDQ